MGLAQAHAPVHEQGVVGPGGAVRHGPGRGIGEIVGGADDEIIEGIAGVHHHFRAVVRQLFVLLPLVAQDKKHADRVPLVDFGQDLLDGDRVQVPQGVAGCVVLRLQNQSIPLPTYRVDG